MGISLDISGTRIESCDFGTMISSTEKPPYMHNIVSPNIQSISYSPDSVELNLEMTKKEYRKVLELLDNNKKEEKEKMELLKIYVRREKNKIDEARDAKYDEIKKADKLYNEFLKLSDKAEELNAKIIKDRGISEGRENIVLGGYTNGLLSKESRDKLKELEVERFDALTTLEKLENEVEARLTICESEASKIEVLKLYGILDESGKISV